MKKRLLDYKIKNRYLIYMIMFSYIFGSFLGLLVHNVSALTSVSESFVDGTIGQNFTGTWFYTKPLHNGMVLTPSGFTVGNVAKTGLKGFSNIEAVSGACRGFFNITTGNNVMRSFTYYIKALANTIGGTSWNFLSSWSPYLPVITLQGGANSSTTFYYKYAKFGGGWQFVGNFYSTNWTMVKIIWLSNDVVTVQIGNKITTLTTYYAPIGLYNITSIYVNENFNAPGQGFYYDDFEYSYDTSFPEPGSICGYDMSGYDIIGKLETRYNTGIASKFLYENYLVPISTTIKGVELSVSKFQYNIDHDLNNYHLSINNGVSINPVCFYQVEDSSYVLFWDTNGVLNNETYSLNFTHDVLLSVDKYWYVDNGGSENDLDFDGDVHSGYGGVSFTDCKWIWILFIPWHVCTDYFTNQLNCDLSYRIYHTGIQTTDIYNYTDELGLSGYSYKNTTGYVYNLADEKSIICSYTLGDNSYSYTLELYKNNSIVYDDTFTYSCIYPGGTVGITPDTIGKYVFKLKKVGYVANITAYVIGSLPNYSIRTQPPISDIYQPYNILYRYYHPQGNIGSCAMFNDFSLVNDYTKKIYGNEIGVNITGTFSYSSNGDSSEFWRLFIERNNIYYPVGKVSEHYIRIPGIVDNSISCNVYTLEINSGNPEQKSVIITGSHIFPGSEVKVYVDNKELSSIGGSQRFTVFYYPLKPGIFTVDLRLTQNGTQTILATTPQDLTITVNSVSSPGTNLFTIPAPWSYFAGTFIIILLTITPIIFGYIFKISLDNIPQFLYLVFALIGFVISLLFEFFPMWSISVLVVVAALIIVIMWLQRKIV